MAYNFKFIHGADIHLGSILHVRQKIDNTIYEVFDNAVYIAFERICNIAIKEKVKFILLSGDIYDKEARSVKANSFFVKQCRKLESENINIFIIGGNHDPVKGNKEFFHLPSNVYIFSADKAETIELKDHKGNVYCKIIGQSYKDIWDSRKIYENYILNKDNIFSIAMLHTQLDNSNNYIPCTFSDLKEIGNIDYWALGHIHKPKVINLIEPTAIYPGIPQGRDAGEEGIGGALLLEVIDRKIQEIKFMKTSPIVWKNLAININEHSKNDIKNLSDLENIILKAAEALISCDEAIPDGFTRFYEDNSSSVNGYVINFKIHGRGEIYNFINDKEEEIEDYLIESLNNKLLKKSPFVYVNYIEFYINRSIDEYEELNADNDMLKAIAATVKECLKDEEMKIKLTKKLGAIWEEDKNREDINEKKLQLDNEIYEDIIIEAEQLIIDFLLSRNTE